MSKGDHGLRTKGTHTGNFGKARVKAGSKLADLGHSDKDVIRIAPREEYIKKMILLYETAPTKQLQCFAYQELHRLNCFEEHRCQPSVTPPYRPKGA